MPHERISLWRHPNSNHLSTIESSAERQNSALLAEWETLLSSAAIGALLWGSSKVPAFQRLEVRQALALVAQAKLAAAFDRCKRAAELSGGSILVGLSGGKDSLVTLDVVCRSGAFSRVEAFAMYLVPGLECFEAPVNAAAERHGVTVHYVPHWDLARMLNQSVLRVHTVRASKLQKQTLVSTERALTKRTAIGWFAYGERAQDSIQRAFKVRPCDGVLSEWKGIPRSRLYPVWDWSNGEVHAYLRARRIAEPIPLTTSQSSGVNLTTECLRAIKKRYPRDYQKILEHFPLAEAQLHRRPEPVPELHDGAASPDEGEQGPVQPASHRHEGAAPAQSDP